MENKHQSCWIDLPKCYSRENLFIDSEEVTPDRISKWNHLDGITTEIPVYLVRVGLLRAVNCIKELESISFVSSRSGGPFVMERHLVGV